MSAIVGFYGRDGQPVDRADLERMTESLAHRGPDGAGVWHIGPVGLGHRMLWTTPESLHEQLPLTGKKGDLVITADARIDNRDELITALGLAQWSHGEITDSELILRAYEQWGEDSPKRLLGDFAFAIWDERRQELFCARDPPKIAFHQGDSCAFDRNVCSRSHRDPHVRRRQSWSIIDAITGHGNDSPFTL